MPIYEYRCSACGHEEEFLRKLSDPPLTDCPACGKATFNKKLSAAGFQLKGSGWYVTDFRGGSKPADVKTGAEPAKTADAAGSSATSADSGGATKSESSGDTKPTPPSTAGTS